LQKYKISIKNQELKIKRGRYRFLAYARNDGRSKSKREGGQRLFRPTGEISRPSLSLASITVISNERSEVRNLTLDDNLMLLYNRTVCHFCFRTGKRKEIF